MIAFGPAANTTVPTKTIRRTTFPRRELPMKKRKNIKLPVGSSSTASSSSSSSSSPSSNLAPEFVSSLIQEEKASSDGIHADSLEAALLLLKASQMVPIKNSHGRRSDSNDGDVRGNKGRRCVSPPRINDVLMTYGQARGEDQSRGRDNFVNDNEENLRAMIFHHIGNRRFRVLVEASLWNYFTSEDEIGFLVRGGWPAERPPDTPVERRCRVARAVIDSVRGNSPPGRFLVCSRRQIDDDDKVGLRLKVATEFEIEGMVHSTFWRAGRYCYYLNRTSSEVVEQQQGEEEVAAAKKISEEVVVALDKRSADPMESPIKSIRKNQQRHLQRRKATTAMVEAASAPGGKKSKISLAGAPFISASLPITFSGNQIDELIAKASPSLMTSSSSSAMTPSPKKTRMCPHPSLPPVPSPTPPESIRTSISSAEGSPTAMAAKKVADSTMLLKPSSRLKIFFSLPVEKFFVDDGERSSIDVAPYLVPTNYDMLCGAGRSFFHHIGNRRFRIMIEMNMERYKTAYMASLPSNGTTDFVTKDGVQKLVDEILHSLSKCDPPTRFLGMDMSTGRWMAMNPLFSQLKTEETFFQCLQVEQLREARQSEEELGLNDFQLWRHEEAVNLIEFHRMRQIEHFFPNNGEKRHSELQNQHEEGVWERFIRCNKKHFFVELEQRLSGSGSGGDSRQLVTDNEVPQNARVLNNALADGEWQDSNDTYVSKASPTQHSESFIGESNLQSLPTQADDLQFLQQQQEHEISQLFAATAAAGMLQELQAQEAAQKISQPLFQAAFASALRSILSNNSRCGASEVVPRE
ncbi:hypothetical protein ACHAXA_011823 [Cyclostephanos tholiformis]